MDNLKTEILDGRIGINDRLVPTLNPAPDDPDNECVEIDRWSSADRIALAETMVKRWQALIDRERKANP